MRAARVLILVTLIAGSAHAQLENPAFDIAGHEITLHVGTGVIDDVVVTPAGDLLVSRPDLQAVGFLDPAAVPAFTPLAIQPVSAPALAIGPDGALYVGDGITGSVLRVDLGTLAVTVAAAGFQIPVDVVFDAAGGMLVADLKGNDFFLSPCDLTRSTMAAGAETSRTLLFAGLPGAADVAEDAAGRLWAAALGSTAVWRHDPASGVLDTPVIDAAGPTDLFPLADGRMLIATLGFAEVIVFDPARGVVERLASGLGGAGGVEDLALSPAGRLLAVVQPAILMELDAGSRLRQQSPAQVGQTCAFRLAIAGAAGLDYALGMAASAWTGIVLDPSVPTVPLDPDALFFFTLAPRPAFLGHFDGVLDATGAADPAPIFAIPALPVLAGATVYFAALAAPGAGSPPATWIVTNGVRVVLSP